MFGNLVLVLVIVIATFALVRVGFRLVSARKTTKAQQAQAEIEARTAMLRLEAERSDFELRVTGSSGVLYPLLIGFTGVVMLAISLDPLNLPWAFGGAACMGFALFGFVAIISTIGRTKLVLSGNGFQSPFVGAVPWEDVYGIELQEIRHRGALLAHYLTFFVPELPRVLADRSVWTRLSAKLRPRGRVIVRVHLHNASEHPETLHRIARFLRTRRTGRDYPWLSDWSDEFNLARRRIHELKALEERAGGSLAFFKQDPVRAMQQLESTGIELDTMGAELDRHARRFTLTVVGVTFVAVLILVISLVLKLY